MVDAAILPRPSAGPPLGPALTGGGRLGPGDRRGESSVGWVVSLGRHSGHRHRRREWTEH